MPGDHPPPLKIGVQNLAPECAFLSPGFSSMTSRAKRSRAATLSHLQLAALPPLCSALHSTKGQGASQPYKGASQVSTIQRCAHQTHTKVHALNPYRGACIILTPKTHDLQHFQIHDKNSVYASASYIFSCFRNMRVLQREKSHGRLQRSKFIVN